MSSGDSPQINKSIHGAASPTTGETIGSNEIKAQGSPTASAAGSIAKQAKFPYAAIASKTTEFLRLFVIEQSHSLNFHVLVNLCQALATAHIDASKALDNPKANNLSEAKNERLKRLLLPKNDFDNAISQLFVAKKSGELPNATVLLNQMRKVLTWEALRDSDNETARQNKEAVQKVIGHLNEKMGCASKSVSVSALVKKIVNGLLSTLRKPFQVSAHTNTKANAALSEKHALLEFFCDLMSKQGTHKPSETVSMLFHACPPENLEKLKNAFRQAAAHYPENKEKQDMFKNMADCLKLAIQTGKFINTIKHKKLACLESYNQQPVLELTQEQKNNPDVILTIVNKKGLGLKYASDELKNNRTIVMAAVKQNGWALQFASEALKNDPEIVMAAIKQDGRALKFASEAMRNKPEIVMAAIEPHHEAFDYMGGVLHDDRVRGKAFEFASQALKNNRAFVLNLVKKNGWALEFASEALRNDPEIVMAAVKQNGLALQFASETLQNSLEIVMTAVKQNGLALASASEALKNHLNIVMVAVKQNGLALRFASEALKSNVDIVMSAVKKDGLALDLAPEALRNNFEIVMAAVKQSGLALQFASEALRNNFEIVMAAVKNRGIALQYASAVLKKNLNVVLAAVGQSEYAMAHVGLILQWHPEVMKVFHAKRPRELATPATQE